MHRNTPPDHNGSDPADEGVALRALDDAEADLAAAESRLLAEKAAALDDLRAAVKAVAAPRYASLWAFYEAVGAAHSVSPFTVRNALTPGGPNPDVAKAAARVARAAVREPAAAAA